MTVVTTVAFTVLALAGALTVARLLRAGSLPDRVVALDLLLVLVVSGIAVDTVRTGRGVYLDALVVTALLGFVGTVMVARYLERRR